VVHVLPKIDSTTYRPVLETAGEEVLAGCRCAECGGEAFRLTKRWVKRGLRRLQGDGPGVIAVRQAVCRRCKHCERVHPLDVLPGKTASVELPLAVVEARQCPGATVSAVSHRFGVARATVRNWEQGLATRYLDLQELTRHRALLASAETPTTAVKRVRRAVVAEIERTSQIASTRFVADPRRTDEEERREALRLLLELTKSLGGAHGAADVGAARFRQAVSGSRRSSSCSRA